MNKQPLPDLQLTGITGGAGGIYDNVILEGVCKVNGAVRAQVIKANGVITFNGDATAEEMQANGKLKVGGTLQFGSMEFDGMMTIDKDLRGENCNLNGMLTIKGNGELENLSGEGVFTVSGLLSAGHVDYRLQGQAKAGEIGVETLVIRKAGGGLWNKLASGLIPKLRTELITGSIEGDILDLEFTTADIVRGGIVKIGQGCRIGRVEYLTELSVHPDASVGKVEKSGE
ncbi:hypothetical protein [Paenibacillus tianjinensis]|uniref:Protein CcmA, bactofilin family n=1 Tax=Paenibacillus tianjinensis TaxID=2810347 RepID=A0ABX7L9J1_9BACL|nr:hypothetical protein [Paenibacillus tianjinensis]QSF43090.1 hypothetical protein JRJ22_17570 [Paenibacillus tianjinensis]